MRGSDRDQFHCPAKFYLSHLRVVDKARFGVGECDSGRAVKLVPPTRSHFSSRNTVKWVSVRKKRFGWWVQFHCPPKPLDEWFWEGSETGTGQIISFFEPKHSKMCFEMRKMRESDLFQFHFPTKTRHQCMIKLTIQ